MYSTRIKNRARITATLAVLALGLAACGGDDEGADTGAAGDAGAEVDGEPILVGSLADLSGPTSDVGTPYSEGVRGYVEWRNEQGGIAGRPIELLWEDYQYDVGIAERLYTDFSAQGVVAIQGWGTADTEALRGLVNADEIPFMSASYSEELTNLEETPFNFIVATSYSDQMRIALRWIHEQDPGAQVAVFHNDSPFGLSPVADGEAYIEENGLDLGYQVEVMPGGATDFVGELRRVAGNGVSYVIVQNVESPAALLAGDIADQGLDIQVVLLNWAGGELFIDLAGDNAEGAVSVQPWTPISVEVPGQDEPRAFLEAQDQELSSLHYTQGWWKMALLADAIEPIVEAGDEVTGPAIRDALSSVEDFDTQGVSLPITLTPRDDGRRTGMVCSPLWTVEGGEWTPLVDELCP
ncbi:MAG TPA: ABC transporter substrate-binding protein [Jiangellales bacterium]|nr:ABC transporter substrate-binding protein [Jiangellales bacterium]